MAYVLIKLNTAVVKTRIVLYNQEVRDVDELELNQNLSKLASYLNNIQIILERTKDIFGYPTQVASLSDSQWNYFHELYCLLVKIFEDEERNLRCPHSIRRFNNLCQNQEIDPFNNLKEILHSLENLDEPKTS